ncbi:uncharacterized protein [Choristoneura fumiferana]|uniref:uncharacterized protein n=1 Tax=Choristoneura fumiferana TaxID=7141 RepID=UPI003D15B9E3
MAASSLVRSLLALACFALLLAGCSANHRRSHRSKAHRRSNTPNCVESLTGSGTSDALILRELQSRGYESNVVVDNIDHCYLQHKKLSGSLIKACDLLGVPPPSILSPSILSQIVTCHTSGPCPNGMVITVTQFCSPM